MIYGWIQSGPVIQHQIDLLDSCKDGHISQILASGSKTLSSFLIVVNCEGQQKYKI